jgi:hypothetical protein
MAHTDSADIEALPTVEAVPEYCQGHPEPDTSETDLGRLLSTVPFPAA